MASSGEYDPAVGRSYQLGDGPRVRLRMVGPRDAASIRALLDRQGLEVDDLELARLVRFDPRCRAVICASALIGPTETIIALGVKALAHIWQSAWAEAGAESKAPTSPTAVPEPVLEGFFVEPVTFYPSKTIDHICEVISC